MKVSLLQGRTKQDVDRMMSQCGYIKDLENPNLYHAEGNWNFCKYYDEVKNTVVSCIKTDE